MLTGISMRQGNSQASAELAKHLGQAHQLLQLGRVEQSEAVLRSILNAAPQSVDAWHLFALCRKSAQDFVAAEDAFQRALRLQPKHQHILNNYANMLVKLKRFQDAERLYKTAIQAQPDYVDAWLNLGILYTQIEALTPGIQTLERAYQIAPNNLAVQNALGLALKRQGRFDEAIAVFHKALKNEPRAQKIAHNLGLALLSAERANEALTVFKDAIGKGMDTVEMRMNCASALDQMGKIETAIAAYRGIIASDPDFVLAYEALSKLLWNSGHTETYADHFEEGLRLRPNNVNLRRSYSLALYKGKFFERALETLLYIKEKDGLMADLGLFYAALGRHEEAETAFEKALKTEPNNIGILTAFAHQLLCAHKPELAQQHAYRAAQLMPEDQFAWAYLGLSWRLLNDSRYYWLNDYQNFVQAVEIDIPNGFSDLLEFNAGLEIALLNFHVSKHHPADQTLRTGTQTNGALFLKNDPMINLVQTQIETAINDVVGRLPDDHKHPFLRRKSPNFRFSGSWSARLFSSGYHVNHVHPQGWMSSAYYVALPDAVCDGRSYEGHIQFGVPPTEMGYDLPAERVVQPKVGTLVLFPSYMWHGTIPFEGDQHRMTIAFDVAPI